MDTRDADGARGLVRAIDRQLMYERRSSASNDRSMWHGRISPPRSNVSIARPSAVATSSSTRSRSRIGIRLHDHPQRPAGLCSIRRG
jgi:hypothetical protein